MVIGVIIVSYSVGRGPWHSERATTETRKFQSDRGKSNLERVRNWNGVCLSARCIHGLGGEIYYMFSKNGEPKSRLRTDGFDVSRRSGGLKFRSK